MSLLCHNAAEQRKTIKKSLESLSGRQKKTGAERGADTD
jgi:hypothetical protein